MKVVGSGRTDAGVHALAQVAHFRTQSPITSARLLRSLNQLLPADIAVTEVSQVPSSFHAQFDTCSKRYRYRIFIGPVVPPFIRRYVHHVRAPLNVSLMRREAEALKGRHEFRGFATAASVQSHAQRTIYHVELIRRGPELQFEVEGNGFLHTMVRSIAGTLLDVGRGRLPPGTIGRMLRTGRRALSGTTAPARGLALVHVRYDPCL